MLQCGCHRKIFPWPNGSDQLSFWLVEPSKSEPYLNGIDARIRARYSGIGDMQVAHLRAPIISAAQKVNAESAGWGEIDMRSALRHLYVCKKCPASDLYIGHGVSVRSKIPFECKWIDGEPVCRIRSLCHDKKRNDIHGIFKASTQKNGPMGIRQNPAVPCAPPHQSGSSWPPPCGPSCARTVQALVRKTTHANAANLIIVKFRENT